MSTSFDFTVAYGVILDDYQEEDGELIKVLYDENLFNDLCKDIGIPGQLQLVMYGNFFTGNTGYAIVLPDSIIAGSPNNGPINLLVRQYFNETPMEKLCTHLNIDLSLGWIAYGSIL